MVRRRESGRARTHDQLTVAVARDAGWIERRELDRDGALTLPGGAERGNQLEQRLAEGAPLEQAVIDAGAIRFRPMLLTAAAVVVGAFVILFDPIFQGLAISLMAGEVASLLLSRMTVPVVFFLMRRRELRQRSRLDHLI